MVNRPLQALALVLGRAPGIEAHRRWTAVARATVTAVLGRGLGMAIGFVTVPLTVGLLGAERYGAWMTMLGLLAWLELGDLGLGSGVTSAVAATHGTGRDEEERAHVSTAFWLLSAIAFLGGIAFLLAWRRVDWAWLFNVRSDLARTEVGTAVAVAFAFFALGMPLSVAERTYAAKQEGTLVNAWAAVESLAVLAATVAVVRLRSGMVLLMGAIAGARWLARATSATWLFLVHRPQLLPSPRAVRRSSFRLLTRTGGLFLALQICALVTFSSDNIVIARIVGAEAVTPYSIAWRLFTLPSLPIMIAFPFLWPAYTEALARGDRGWVVRAFRLSAIWGPLAALVAALPLVVFGQPLIRWWAGAAAVPSAALLAWMGAWAVVNALSNAIACLLNAAGRLGLQVVYATATAIVNLALSVLLARVTGGTGVIAATVIAYATCVLVPAGLQARAFLSELERTP